jgi:hypothetical protein
MFIGLLTSLDHFPLMPGTLTRRPSRCLSVVGYTQFVTVMIREIVKGDLGGIGDTGWTHL